MKSFVPVILLFCLIASCSKETKEKNQLSFTEFQNSFQEDMDYFSMLEIFGEPDKDVGSGIHIYVYILSDSTEIWIGYTDKILYARHVDQDQNILHYLIEESKKSAVSQ